MKEPKIDAERIAALLDGRLEGPERAEVLAHLASSEEDFEAFVDAVAVTRERELESAARPPDRVEGVIPLRTRARSRWWARSDARWLAAAAAVAALALALTLLWSRIRAPGQDDPGRMVALLAAKDRGLPSNWDGSPWETYRSGDERVTRGALSARLGAGHVELEVALRGRDAAAAELAAMQVAELLRKGRLGTLASEYDSIGKAARRRESRELLESALERARHRINESEGVERERMALGAWAQAARIAVERRDTAFFETSESGVLKRAAGLPLPPSAASAVGRIRSALEVEGEPDWELLRGRTRELLAALAS